MVTDSCYINFTAKAFGRGFIACSETLYFSLSSACDKFKNRGGFIDRHRKGVGVGEEENWRSLFSFLALRTRQFFEKQKRKTEKNVCVQARGFTPLEVKATLLKSYRKSSESEEEER